MPKTCYAQVALETTPYYHCISRFVHRAFLCGFDNTTGNNYEHRRQLIENKILELSSIFAIDICAYSVMSNHYRLVLHINKAQAEKWTPGEVIRTSCINREHRKMANPTHEHKLVYARLK